MKPRLISSIMSTVVAAQVPNPRMLLAFGIEAVRIQLTIDESEVPNAPNWKKITEVVSSQMADAFGKGIGARLLNAETEEVLVEPEFQEADTVVLEVMSTEPLVSRRFH